MEKTRMNLGIIVPGFGDVYDPEREYEFYMWVRDGCDAYISKKPSKGIPTSNEEYWFRVTGIESLITENINGTTVILGNVPEWALSPQKPTYRYDEIKETPDIPAFPDLSDVAVSGSYNDLKDTPDIPALPTLSEVARTGSYNDLADSPAIPAAISDLTNDADFQTGEQVQDAIADAVNGLAGFSVVIVETLPEAGECGVIYLMENASGENDQYDEYLWAADRFERIGSAAADLSGYVPSDRTINGKRLDADVVLTAQDLDAADMETVMDTVASRWSFMRDGNPVTIYPAEGSVMRITPGASGTLQLNDGDPMPVTAGTPVDIKAAAGVNTLITSDGMLRVEYNRSSMDLLAHLTASVSDTDSIAQIAGVVGDLPLDVTARLIAAQEGAGDPSPDNARPFVGRNAFSVMANDNTYSITLPETLYGIPNAPVTIDFTAGTAMEPTGEIGLTGLQPGIYNYTIYKNQPDVVIFGHNIPGFSAPTGAPLGAINCTHLPRASTWPNANYSATTPCVFMHGSQGANFYTVWPKAWFGYAEGDNDATVISKLKAALAAEHSAGRTVKIRYQLATPVTHTIDPLIIPAITGVNNVWTDGGGETTITGRQGAQGMADRLSALESFVKSL